jgi:hypothetical protein
MNRLSRRQSCLGKKHTFNSIPTFYVDIQSADGYVSSIADRERDIDDGSQLLVAASTLLPLALGQHRLPRINRILQSPLVRSRLLRVRAIAPRRRSRNSFAEFSAKASRRNGLQARCCGRNSAPEKLAWDFRPNLAPLRFHSVNHVSQP